VCRHDAALSRANQLKSWCADYEVDFITYFTKLTGTKMGAKFNDNAYLQSMQMDNIRL